MNAPESPDKFNGDQSAGSLAPNSATSGFATPAVTSAFGTTSSGTSFSRLTRLARKELRESLRDRRTLATLILMPLIVYPLLGSVVQKFAISRVDPAAPPAVVALDETFPDQLLQPLLDDQRVELARQQKAENELSALESSGGNPAKSKAESEAQNQGGDQPGNLRDGDQPEKDASEQLKEFTEQLASGNGVLDGEKATIKLSPSLKSADVSFEELIQDGSADVAVRMIPESINSSTGAYEFGQVEILYRRNDPFSAKAANEVERRFRDVRDDLVRRSLLLIQADTSIMPRMKQIALTSTGPTESPLSAFVPLMLVLMTMTGAVYPAIDLTAGERERGTLEMLMAAPVSRRALLTAKFVAVFTVAVLTAIINLVAMLLTIYGTGFDRVILGDSVSLGTFLQVFSLLVVFASFFSAVLLGITSFARSFREAQAWLIPLMLISLAPGILSLMPGVRLTPGFSLIPLVNIVLLGKELFQGIASPLLFAITLAATAVYTLMALRIAAGVFGSDTVLFGSSTRPKKQSQEYADRLPKSVAILCLLILAPAFVVLAGMRGRLVAPENLSGQLVLSGVMTIALFAVLPVIVTMLQKVRISRALAITEFSVVSLIGAVLLGMTLWTLMYEMLLLGKGVSGWTELLKNPRLQQLANRLLHDTPLILRLMTLAAIPAVCEELFFRGLLMNALYTETRKWQAPLLITSLTFAAFHVIVDQSLTLERFPATFLLGMVLGWVRITTGSIIPGIAMHAMSNGLLLSLKDLQPTLAKLGVNLALENETHLPIGFLLACGAAAIAGAFLVHRGSRFIRN